MAESEVECFSPVKQLKIALKTEGGIDGKEKHKKREVEGKRCPLDNFSSRKTRMHRETASEMVSLP